MMQQNDQENLGKQQVLVIGYGDDMRLATKSIKDRYLVTEAILRNCPEDANVLSCPCLSSYNYIVIAIEDKQAARNMHGLLKAILDQDSRKVIDFYLLYRAALPSMTVDRVMKNPLKNRYNGIILGISHAQVGILPQLLNGDFCNLSVSSQDIYYNMKTLEYCMNTYANKIQDLKYLIFDMYDYTYFNYDVSLSRHSSVRYYSWGGYTLDQHHFDEIKSFDFTFDDYMNLLSEKRYADIDEAQIDLWDTLFENVYAGNGFKDFDSTQNLHFRLKTVSDKEIKEFHANASVVKNIFQESIRENIEHFCHLLELAYSINPNIKICCILMPRYCETWSRIKTEFVAWKEVFYNIMEELQNRYTFTFLDLTEHEIARRRECYADASHLNYYGAIEFTKLLNSLIQ
ncbi:MAG: SGNH/GDSL hydrolase family protein [Lachnospiraceae bacterium]|nr:SGNH/GDSL hydrolase family protein [Lachnospiraceae bacterium]